MAGDREAAATRTGLVARMQLLQQVLRDAWPADSAAYETWLANQRTRGLRPLRRVWSNLIKRSREEWIHQMDDLAHDMNEYQAWICHRQSGGTKPLCEWLRTA